MRGLKSINGEVRRKALSQLIPHIKAHTRESFDVSQFSQALKKVCGECEIPRKDVEAREIIYFDCCEAHLVY